MKRHLAFTLVELFVIIVVIAILAAVSYMGYGSWQRSFADRAVQHDLLEASGGLERYKNSNNYYPSNLAGTGFAASPVVAMKFKTNSQQVPYYTSLTPDENAQLLLNSCNSYMPTVANGTTYNTACSFAGNNFHIQGTQSTNVLLQGPTIQQSEFVLTCGAVCDAAQASIVSVFGTQGGYWPVVVPKKQVALPEPTYIPIENTGTKYCPEGVATNFGDIVYHTTSTDKTPVQGPCPADPDLHYP